MLVLKMLRGACVDFGSPAKDDVDLVTPFACGRVLWVDWSSLCVACKERQGGLGMRGVLTRHSLQATHIWRSSWVCPERALQ